MSIYTGIVAIIHTGDKQSLGLPRYISCSHELPLECIGVSPLSTQVVVVFITLQFLRYTTITIIIKLKPLE